MFITKANHFTLIKSPLNIESPQKKVYKYGFRYYTLLQGFEIRFLPQPTILLRSFHTVHFSMGYVHAWAVAVCVNLSFNLNRQMAP